MRKIKSYLIFTTGLITGFLSLYFMLASDLSAHLVGRDYTHGGKHGLHQLVSCFIEEAESFIIDSQQSVRQKETSEHITSLHILIIKCFRAVTCREDRTYLMDFKQLWSNILMNQLLMVRDAVACLMYGVPLQPRMTRLFIQSREKPGFHSLCHTIDFIHQTFESFKTWLRTFLVNFDSLNLKVSPQFY